MASKDRTPQQPKTESYRLEHRNSEKESQQCRFITRGFLIESIRNDEDPDECKCQLLNHSWKMGRVLCNFLVKLYCVTCRERIEIKTYKTNKHISHNLT